ncbi:hypothetical protein [Nocardia lijiangensis]
MHQTIAYPANSKAVQRFSTVENGRPSRGDGGAEGHLPAGR